MATSVPTPAAQRAAPVAQARAAIPQPKVVPAIAETVAAGTALVPAPAAGPARSPGIPADSPAMRLKVELEVGVPVGGFRVKNLLALEPGVVVESQWSCSEDLPLGTGRVQLAWAEFEVSDTQLATRLTRLA